MNALKDSIKRSFKSSKGRFLSIFLLMMIGSFALLGLKVTGPNMRKTAERYFDKTNLSDISIIGSYGIDSDDEKKIDQASAVNQKEYGYFKDVSLNGTDKSLRILSKPDKISKYTIKDGNDLKNETDILLSQNFKDSYNIGDKISINEKAGIEGKYLLKNKTYKVVGFVDSSEYLSYVNMGSSKAGDGNLTGFAYTLDDNFDSDYYMLARIRFEDTKGLDPYSNEYREKIKDHTNELNNLLKNQGAHRLNSLKSDIQKQIDEGEEKINDAQSQIDEKKEKLDNAKDKIANGKDELANADQQLKNARVSLNNGKSTLDEKWNELKKGKNQLDSAKSSLIAAENTLNNAYNDIKQGDSDLASAKKTLANKETELKESKDKFDKANADYIDKKSELESKDSELSAAENEFNEKTDQTDELLSSISEVENNIKDLEATDEEINASLEDPDIDDEKKLELRESLSINKAKLDALNQKLSELNQIKKAVLTPEVIEEIESGKKELAEKRLELDKAHEKLDAGKAELDQKQKEIVDACDKINQGRVTLSEKESQLNQAKSDYQTGITKYRSNLNFYNQNLNAYYQGLDDWNKGFERLNKKEALYQENYEKYKANFNELKQKEKEYQDGLEEFDEKSKEADDKIKDGKEKINDAKKLRDSLEEPVYSVYTRRESLGSSGYTVYTTIADIVDKLSNIFPVFLYFVAALVTLTTMTRFVDEERINSGTLKALGYQDKDIIKKFTIYGFVAGMLGTIFGIFLGHSLFPIIIYNAYGHYFSIPKINLDFYPKMTVISLVLSLISSVLPAYVVSKKQLDDKPANLLIPKPPAKGSQILLEKISPVWERMGFIQKVTARNIFRYKKRMFMTIFGVAGAATLLFAGFSVQRSIAGIETTQFGDIINYDLIVAYNRNINNEDNKQIDKLLALKDINNHTGLHYEKATKVAGNFNDKQEINLLISDSTNKVNEFIDLRERKSKKPIKLSDNGVIISERLADITDSRVGDEITIKDEHKNERKVKIVDITEMYAGHFMFMSDKYYQKAFGKKYKANADIVSLDNSSLDNTKNVASSFMNIDGVKGVVSNTLIENQTNIVVTALNKIMLLIIVVATLLAIVILYNLTNINIQERIRELSTIKVLGFYDNEVSMYIYRETIFLTILGILLGYILGDILFRYILRVVPPAEIMFNPSLTYISFAIPLAIIGIITIILGRYVYRKLKYVDMLEALQSIE